MHLLIAVEPVFSWRSHLHFHVDGYGGQVQNAVVWGANVPYGVTFHPVAADGGRRSQFGPDAGARPALGALGSRVLSALRGSAFQKVGEHLTFALHTDLAATLEVVVSGE